jgi:hypothetical protein
MYFFIRTAELIFDDSRIVYTAAALCAVSPWHIRDAMFTLDCNYLPHIMIIGIYFLTKAVKSEKPAKYYAAAMLFFGLCFYCYLMSAIIIPVFLTVTYLLLLIKKKISISDCALSVAVLVLIGLPFILFLLVVYGFAEPFRLFGFNYEMPYYHSYQFLSDNRDSSVLSVIAGKIADVFAGIMDLVMPDYQLTNATSSFMYTNFVGGIAAAYGLGYVLLKERKTDKNFPLFIYTVTSFVLSVIITLFTVIATTYALYRFGCVNYIFLMLEAYGFILLADRISNSDKLNIKNFRPSVMIAAFLAVSVLLTAGNYAYHSVRAINDEPIYCKNALEALDYIDSKGYKDIELLNVDNKECVVCRLHYYGSDERKFIPFEEDYLGRAELKAGERFDITEDGSICYISIENGYEPDCECALIYKRDFDKVKIDYDKYEVKDFGSRVVIARK